MGEKSLSTASKVRGAGRNFLWSANDAIKVETTTAQNYQVVLSVGDLLHISTHHCDHDSSLLQKYYVRTNFLTELPEIPIARCTLRQMPVILKDEDRNIRNSGKWPLLIDISEQASTFLGYQDANYLCAFNSKEMEEDRIRMGLLGAIR